MKKNRISLCVGAAAVCLALTLGATADEARRPAKISQADIAGAIFKGPHVKKVTEGSAHALEVDTLMSADKKFTTGIYQSGPEHSDIKDGYPEYEFFYVLKGSITLTDGGGAQVIGAGEAVTIPKGWKGHWDSDGYTKVWVTYETEGK